MLDSWLLHPHAMPWMLVMFVAGLLGSLGHCAGMCGPVVAAFGLAQGRRGGPAWPRHALFQLGRIFTYAVLGGLIGYLGGFARLQTVQDMHACCRPEGAALVAAQAWPWQLWVKLAIGALMLLLGLALMLGRRIDSLMEWRMPAPVQRLLGKGLGLAAFPFLLGMVWGLIPCGLVYMMLLRALDGGSWRMGATGMAMFGLGSSPLLLGLGLASTRLSQAWKSNLMRLGGVVVAGMGLWILTQAWRLFRAQGS
ncbi:MAG: sulfite exporter TauE/SafE family protein [Acidobacteria bacterium]|nr:sulfite exporter TauE/SafE family protein [Acidobacteriota bacterium]